MTQFKTFTDAERAALKLHGLDTDGPSQLSDAFVLGMRYAAASPSAPTEPSADDFKAAVLRCRYPVCKTIHPSGWGWDTSRLNEVIEDDAATPSPAAGGAVLTDARSPKDYAIEHAGYMADAAKLLMERMDAEFDAREALEAAEAADADDAEQKAEDLRSVEQDVVEARSTLRSRIHGFEAHRDLAARAILSEANAANVSTTKEQP